MSANHRKKIINLWSKNPRCYWCGRKTILYHKGGKGHPANAATIDHIYDRIKGRPDKGRLVLACKECNEKRGLQAVQTLTRFQQWMRSGRFPRLSTRMDGKVIESKAALICERCGRKGALDFGDVAVCLDCYGVCLNCQEWFILGSDSVQQLCWRCVNSEAALTAALPYWKPANGSTNPPCE